MPPKNNGKSRSNNHPSSNKKKKKGRAPKHQNTFAFRHNPKSKKTDKILSSPNVGVCRRCHDKIEWRKKYRKYKPRTQPGKCNLCSQKNVMAAYHTICTNCAMSDAAFVAMEKKNNNHQRQQQQENNVTTSNEHEEETCVLAHSGDEEIEPQEQIKNSNNTLQKSSSAPRKRYMKVCAMCTSEFALSKYNNNTNGSSSTAVHQNANGDDADEELLDEIEDLEEMIKTGIHSSQGHKLTLREVKALERQLNKLRLEAMGHGKHQCEDSSDDEDEDDEESDDEYDEEQKSVDDNSRNDNGDSSVDGENDNDYDEAEDPFLLAVGGKDKLLVGEEYQKMLLSKEKQHSTIQA